MILAINHGDAHILAREVFGAIKAGKTTAHDHHLERGSRCLRYVIHDAGTYAITKVTGAA